MTVAAPAAPPAHGRQNDSPYFSAEHDELRAEIAEFVETELRPYAAGWEDTLFPTSVFRQLGERGWLGLRYPREYGGLERDYMSSIVLSEELAKADSGGMTLGLAIHTDMATPPIFKFGSEEQRQRYLVPAIRGEKIACLGLTEPGAGSDLAGIQTTAVQDGDDWVINGGKIYIGNGTRADFIVLLVKTNPEAGLHGLTIFLVDTDTPGFEVVRKLEKLGMAACDGAELRFTDMRVPSSAILGKPGRGFMYIMWELQGERLNGAAGCTAAAQRLFEQTLERARTRNAFGQPIGQFQAIRHKLAEQAVKLESARQLVYSAGWKFQHGGNASKEIAMAKLHAARVGFEVADVCLQVHGGAGYMRETGVERIWRDMRLNRIGAGTDEIMLEIISRSLMLAR